MSEAEDASILGDNLTAVEAISAKLAEVTRLAEKLDARLCEAGARTRPMSIPTVMTSSASSLLSISAMSPSSASVHTASNTTALTSGITASAVSVIAQIHPITSETVTTKIKSDVVKSITSTAEKFDDDSIHDRSRPMEDVETSNKDFNSKELIENSRSESAAGDYNIEGYTTATECSTPPPHSRSESFVTSPECEDLSIIAPVVTYSGSTWWDTEKPKLTTTIAPLTSTSNNENQKFAETISNTSIISGIKPTARMETMDKITNEMSNRIVKEVTETTVLRVSHDIRLDVASYKVVSNTIQDHRQHTDMKDIQNVERVLETESREETDGIHHHLDLSPFKESKNYIDKSSKKVQSNQNIATKLTKVREHTLNESTCSNLKEYKEGVLSSSKDFLQHHEDSGIEISSMKKNDNLEDEYFLEKARKL